MAKTILESAMEDTQKLKETAVEVAKNTLVEALSPKIRKLIDSQLGESMSMYEDEKHDDEAADLEMLKQLGVLDLSCDAEDQENKEDKKEEYAEVAQVGQPQIAQPQALQIPVVENDKEDEDNMEKGKEDVVELDEAELKAALSEVLKSLKEADVSKGFGDQESAAEGGLLDKAAGEKQLSEVEPPAAEDLTVKESASDVAKLTSEVARLTKENAEIKAVCEHLKGAVQEATLFSSRLLHSAKLLQSANLTNEQRARVVEAFDKAKSTQEVEFIYNTLSESFKIAGVLGEAKQAKAPSMKGPKASRFMAPSSTVLKESAEKEAKAEPSRWEQLAGLVD